MTHCEVTHAPGQHYVCWTHKRFLPWSEPLSTNTECSCDRPRKDTDA
jgi:hypothetical protein